MKRILSLLLCILIFVLLSGCESKKVVNVEYGVCSLYYNCDSAYGTIQDPYPIRFQLPKDHRALAITLCTTNAGGFGKSMSDALVQLPGNFGEFGNSKIDVWLDVITSGVDVAAVFIEPDEAVYSDFWGKASIAISGWTTAAYRCRFVGYDGDTVSEEPIPIGRTTFILSSNIQYIEVSSFLSGNDGTYFEGALPGSVSYEDAFEIDDSEVILNDSNAEVTSSCDLPELPESFVFASGAGAWSTEVHINPDGTFTGYYSDSDMGDVGDDYPNGIQYECRFSGKFTEVKKISDYEYSMKIDFINSEGKVNAENIVDGVKIITTEPYGFAGADEFLLYLPGRDTADLPDEFLEWVCVQNAWRDVDVPDLLPFYGLYNVSGGEGFIS